MLRVFICSYKFEKCCQCSDIFGLVSKLLSISISTSLKLVRTFFVWFLWKSQFVKVEWNIRCWSCPYNMFLGFHSWVLLVHRNKNRPFILNGKWNGFPFYLVFVRNFVGRSESLLTSQIAKWAPSQHQQCFSSPILFFLPDTKHFVCKLQLKTFPFVRITFRSGTQLNSKWSNDIMCVMCWIQF